MDPVDKFKLAAAIFIWALAIVGGTAPLLSRQRVSKRASSVLNMVAAGIFLASSCMHLLPDAQNNEALTEWGCEHTAEVFLAVRTRYHGDNKRCFKWANFFYGCGFLMVLLIEVLAHTLQRHYSKVHGNGHAHGAEQERDALLAVEVTRAAELDNLAKTNGHSHGQLETGDYGTQGESKGLAVHTEDGKEEPHSHIHGIVKGNPILALVVFIALSFHSVMEGMGMGASSSPAWDILVAILAHKSLAAFALALEFLHHNVSRKQFLSSVAVFSLMTPMGILFGRLLVDSNHATPAGGVCAAFAGGTFLFVAIMEIIPQELQDPRYQLEKCSALLAGYGAMGVLSLWT
ncbi:Zinc (Zn2)-Iron (Fe2) Permease (ZIP) Family [Phytophthora palmivora]|uniref:Zinc (Zn2)-Iron (Fe2) Permease (ZIP) Family n=1 Tax=Phytophthora palmivora TaxID=4796 RepID=A0A2P4XZC3_9STRA|nr:Zinc (Zn2)-Iron (Fe2) Permease (ZIP) Family [Phytophthora palmivora]